MLVFVSSQAGVVSLEAAFWISLSYSVASLFIIGAMAATRGGIVWGIVAGAVFATLGAAIIAAEASIR